MGSNNFKLLIILLVLPVIVHASTVSFGFEPKTISWYEQIQVIGNDIVDVHWFDIEVNNTNNSFVKSYTGLKISIDTCEGPWNGTVDQVSANICMHNFHRNQTGEFSNCSQMIFNNTDKCNFHFYILLDERFVPDNLNHYLVKVNYTLVGFVKNDKTDKIVYIKSGLNTNYFSYPTYSLDLRLPQEVNIISYPKNGIPFFSPWYNLWSFSFDSSTSSQFELGTIIFAYKSDENLLKPVYWMSFALFTGAVINCLIQLITVYCRLKILKQRNNNKRYNREEDITERSKNIYLKLCIIFSISLLLLFVLGFMYDLF